MNYDSSSSDNKSRKRIFMILRQRQRMSFRMVVLTASSLMFLFAGVLLTYFQFVRTGTVRAAAASGDYRSIASGNWNGATTWEKFNGSTWDTTSTPPSSTNNVIEIRSTHVVTVTAAATVDQVLVDAGGVVVLNTLTTLTLANGSNTDMDVYGIFKNAGTVTINSGATIVYESNGKYQHNFTTTGGAIPTATWSAGSTCEVIGYTTNTTAPTGFQSFSNFTWNCPNQTVAINLSNALTTVNGNFTVTSTGTGSGELRLATSAYTCNIGGNYIQTGGLFTIVTANNAVVTINVSGNWTHTGGTLTTGGNNNTAGSFVFNKSGTVIFTASGNTVSGKINFTVNSGAILSLGTNIVTGNNFTLSSGAGILIGSTAGITSSGATGNVQSSGSRSFSTGANYTYNGSTAQVSGSGLPATVANLTLTNTNGLTLTNSVSASGIISMASSITTGSNILTTTNTSTTSVTGYTSSIYVIGNLKRSVSSSGTYDFPIGTSSKYEPITVALLNITPTNSIQASFTNSTPVNSSYPLAGLLQNSVHINTMLDYGYWTLSPNAAMSGGSYTVTLKEQGYSNTIASTCVLPALSRSSSSSSWTTNGTHVSQSVSGGIATIVRSGLTSLGDFGIGMGDSTTTTMYFNNTSLISGTDGAVNAIYKIPNAVIGVDAWCQILDLTGGATLSGFDNFVAGNGYDEAWQPYVNCPALATSSIGWKIMFKKAGTSVDTTLSTVAITGIDIDGNGAELKEFVEATSPASYSTDPSTLLVITNSAGLYRATSGTTASINNIDTARKEAMYQANYYNVNTFNYRTGAVSNDAGSNIRQNSIYFKTFFTSVGLPIELMYFKAKLNEGLVNLSWATATETNNEFFTIERSENGKDFKELLRKPGAGNSSHTLFYTASDDKPLAGTSYYRLKQTDYDGKYAYSAIRSVKNNGIENSDIEIKEVYPNPITNNFTINYSKLEGGLVTFSLFTRDGKLFSTEKINAQKGSNEFLFHGGDNLPAGTYIISLSSDQAKVSKTIVKK